MAEFIAKIFTTLGSLGAWMVADAWHVVIFFSICALIGLGINALKNA